MKNENSKFNTLLIVVSSIYSAYIKATVIYSAFVSIGWGFDDEVVWLSFVVLFVWLLVLLLLTILGSLLRN